MTEGSFDSKREKDAVRRLRSFAAKVSDQDMAGVILEAQTENFKLLPLYDFILYILVRPSAPTSYLTSRVYCMYVRQEHKKSLKYSS